jgi:hypothetical protein
VDSGCIFVSELFEDEGRGRYWEENSSSADDDSSDPKKFFQEMENNQHVVILTVSNTETYQQR